MSEPKKYLFVGGLRDGEWIATDGKRHIEVAEPRRPISFFASDKLEPLYFRTEHYTLHRIDEDIRVYATVADTLDVIRSLIDGYRKPKATP